MREINVLDITKAVKKLCIDANLYLPCDIEESFLKAKETEKEDLPLRIFDTMLKNLEVAKEKNIPICQDTGMALVFIKIGQDVHLTGGNLNEAINEGVRQGYIDGYLRLSVVKDPLIRENTNDNTPAIIYTEIVDGENVEIMVAPKGFGSENMSKTKMFNPSAKPSDIVDFVANACIEAGSSPCPPIIVGVGLGGTMEKAALLSKEAMLKPIDEITENKLYKDLEDEILKKVNESGIGPQGLGGKTTALSVKILPFATHIAGLPCAVSIGCHVTRHKSVIV